MANVVQPLEDERVIPVDEKAKRKTEANKQTCENRKSKGGLQKGSAVPSLGGLFRN